MLMATDHLSSSGPDADLLQVDEDGEVTFIAAPDYEVLSDSDANGTYIAILTAVMARMNRPLPSRLSL